MFVLIVKDTILSLNLVIRESVPCFYSGLIGNTNRDLEVPQSFFACGGANSVRHIASLPCHRWMVLDGGSTLVSIRLDATVRRASRLKAGPAGF